MERPEVGLIHVAVRIHVEVHTADWQGREGRARGTAAGEHGVEIGGFHRAAGVDVEGEHLDAARGPDAARVVGVIGRSHFEEVRAADGERQAGGDHAG